MACHPEQALQAVFYLGVLHLSYLLYVSPPRCSCRVSAELLGCSPSLLLPPNTSTCTVTNLQSTQCDITTPPAQLGGLPDLPTLSADHASLSTASPRGKQRSAESQHQAAAGAFPLGGSPCGGETKSRDHNLGSSPKALNQINADSNGRNGISTGSGGVGSGTSAGEEKRLVVLAFQIQADGGVRRQRVGGEARQGVREGDREEVREGAGQGVGGGWQGVRDGGVTREGKSGERQGDIHGVDGNGQSEGWRQCGGVGGRVSGEGGEMLSGRRRRMGSGEDMERGDQFVFVVRGEQLVTVREEGAREERREAAGWQKVRCAQYFCLAESACVKLSSIGRHYEVKSFFA